MSKPMELGALRVGSYKIIDGEPCRIMNYTKSKPGKHGSTKIRLEAMGIFDHRRRFLLKPSSADVSVPVIEKKTAQVISISGEIAQLMDMQEYNTFEASIPEELKDKIEAGREVLYWKIGNKILIKELR